MPELFWLMAYNLVSMLSLFILQLKSKIDSEPSSRLFHEFLGWCPFVHSSCDPFNTHFLTRNSAEHPGIGSVGVSALYIVKELKKGDEMNLLTIRLYRVCGNWCTSSIKFFWDSEEVPPNWDHGMVAPELSPKAWTEPWEVGGIGTGFPGRPRAVDPGAPVLSVPVKQRGLCLVCLAPPFLVKDVSLFIQIGASLTIWWISPPTGTPLKSPSLAKKVSHGALLPRSTSPGTNSWSPEIKCEGPACISVHWVIWPLYTGNSNNADLRTNIWMCFFC